MVKAWKCVGIGKTESWQPYHPIWKNNVQNSSVWTQCKRRLNHTSKNTKIDIVLEISPKDVHRGTARLHQCRVNDIILLSLKLRFRLSMLVAGVLKTQCTTNSSHAVLTQKILTDGTLPHKDDKVILITRHCWRRAVPWLTPLGGISNANRVDIWRFWHTTYSHS